jgi:DNA-binding XRE family transcriptional regulator
MRSLKKLLGARIRQLREEQALTVAQVAESVGLQFSHMYAIERGDNAPSLEVMAALAALFKVDVADLFAFPSSHPRHELRELLRGIPNAKLEDARAALEAVLRVVSGSARSGARKGPAKAG